MFDLVTQEMSFTDGELIFEQGILVALASVGISFQGFHGLNDFSGPSLLSSARKMRQE